MHKNYFKLLLIGLLFWSSTSIAQSISGEVKDENGDPLPTVAVIVKGTSVNTLTDYNGKYSLSGLTPGNVKVTFSIMGYTTAQRAVEIKSGVNSTLNISMQVDQEELDEVVIVGYGVKRKTEVTNSIVTLETKDLTDIPTPSFENGMQGKASGVQVITGSGIAGSGSMVRIRGVASISAGGDPLYVVDGVIINQDYFANGNGGGFNTNPLASINPNDIENVTILKDAAATGIYGSRGSNGVILITTKRGQGDGLKFEFSSRIGVTNPTARPNMLTGSEYLRMYEEAWVNDGNVGTPTLPGSNVSWEEAQNINTDWVDQTVRTGFKQKYDFGVSNGQEKYNWYTGVSYQNDNSYLAGNSYNRINGRFNLDYRFNDKWEASLSTSLAVANNNRIDAAWSGGLGSAMSTALPIYPIYWDKDTIDKFGNPHQKGDYWQLAGTGNNPVAQRELKDWTDTELRTINNFSVTYKPGKNTFIKAFGGLDYMDFTGDVYEKPGFDLSNVDENGNQLGRAFLTKREIYSTNINLTGTQLWDLDENNHFTFLLGAEYQYNKVNDFGTKANNAAFAPISESGEYERNDNNTPDQWAFASLFGRVNYNYKGKYFAEALFRTDGSSKFGENYKYGLFPAISAGWVITNEDFLKYNPTVSYLKLKASYGINGNSNIPNGRTYNTYRISNTGYNNQPYIYPDLRNNPNLRWETSNTFDIAVEYGFLGDRITGEFAYYRKTTNDMLLNVTLQKANGFDNWWDNVGSVYNTGLELSVNTRNIVGAKFKWETNLNISRNYNEVTSIGSYTEDAVSGGTNDTRVVVGSPIGTNYLVRYKGVDPETGRPVYYDLDGNETFEWDPNNRVVTGSVLPDAIGGITNIFHYSNWDFSFLFVYTIGGNIYDSSSKRQLGAISDWNMRTDIYDRWRQAGDQTEYGALTLDPENHGNSDYWSNTHQWLHDGSYLRLRNVSLSYNIAGNALDKMKLKSFRITAIATNLLTFQNAPVLDPEIARDFENATDRNMSPNITYLTPPQEKTFNLMIQIGF